MDLDTRTFYAINAIARDTPWLRPLMAWYANDGVVLFVALLVAGWWLARKRVDPTAMVAAVWAPLGVVAALWLVNRRLGTVAAVAAALMAFARVYVGAHYPRDVLAGLALGIVVSLAGYFLSRPLLRPLLDLVSKTPLRRLVTTTPGRAAPPDSHR
ncbi:membrane-associated phospholipid phosphatase [Mycobacterium sp. MAA66]|uniref:phosphatase PAP2 family protein n=1 Tax=Mycobacterium sp. MAA66 TaxID=3156297 RepID=UPI00351989FB